MDTCVSNITDTHFCHVVRSAKVLLYHFTNKLSLLVDGITLSLNGLLTKKYSYLGRFCECLAYARLVETL
jgi:hypothetical protein